MLVGIYGGVRVGIMALGVLVGIRISGGVEVGACGVFILMGGTAESSCIFASVFGPTTPTASMPCFSWSFLTASSVFAPKYPVTRPSG